MNLFYTPIIPTQRLEAICFFSKVNRHSRRIVTCKHEDENSKFKDPQNKLYPFLISQASIETISLIFVFPLCLAYRENESPR